MVDRLFSAGRGVRLERKFSDGMIYFQPNMINCQTG